LAAAVSVAALEHPAVANGRYPQASMIAFDPNDASHFVVSASFGLLESHDAGKTFLWRCEKALGVAGQQDLMIAITASGATVSTKFDGIVRTDDGCSFFNPPELAARNMADLALSRSVPHRLLAFYTDSGVGGGFASQIVRSDDDGRTWSPLGGPLPNDLLPLTIDVAPSDDSRVYVSGRLGPANGYDSVLMRSIDGGMTFVSTEVPDTMQHRLTYIGAVHPTNPDRVYLRSYDVAGTRILITDDGGGTFRKVFTGTDQIYGFAVSPDGQSIALGGPGDGIWIGDSDGTGITRRSDILPWCLGWSNDGLYACADQKLAAFSIGRSRDLGVTFDNVLRFESLCGQTGCPADGDAATTCATDWQFVGPAVGSSCGLDAGVVDADTVDGSLADAADEELVDDARNDGPSGPVASVPSSGCDCTLGRRSPFGRTGGFSGIWALVTLGAALRRRGVTNS
jgi:photosystem II stability/assembly factor-like uncharacterized protein